MRPVTHPGRVLKPRRCFERDSHSRNVIQFWRNDHGLFKDERPALPAAYELGVLDGVAATRAAHAMHRGRRAIIAGIDRKRFATRFGEAGRSKTRRGKA